MLERIDRAQDRGTGEREVAEVGAIGALAVVDAIDRFGDQPVHVEIPLAVAMRSEVPRHAIDDAGEVRAVVELDAAQEILVGLAATRVLRGDQARHYLEQLGNPQQRAHRQVGAADRALAGRDGGADQRLAAREDHDLVEVRTAVLGPVAGLDPGPGRLRLPGAGQGGQGERDKQRQEARG